jgi:hypothetical protein
MRFFADRHYEEHLEGEVRRLQRENRELVNAVLAQAGVPGIRGEVSSEPQAPLRTRRNWKQIGRDMTQRTREAIQALGPRVQVATERKVENEQRSS